MPSLKTNPKSPKVASSNSDPIVNLSTTATGTVPTSSRNSSPSSTPTLTPRIPQSTLTPAGTISTSLATPFSRGRLGGGLLDPAAASTGTLRTWGTSNGGTDHGAVGVGLLGLSAPLTRAISDPTTGIPDLERTEEERGGPGSEGSRTPAMTDVTGGFEDFLEGEEGEERGLLGPSIGRGSRSRRRSKSRSKSPSRKVKGEGEGKEKRRLSPLNPSDLDIQLLYRQNRLKGSDTPPNAPPSSWWGRTFSNEGKESASEVGSPGGLKSQTSPTSTAGVGSGAGLEIEVFGYHARGLKGKKKGKEEDNHWRQTRDRVAKATKSIFGSTGAAAVHELLAFGVEVVELAPVPGLKPAARLLLNLWDNLDGVDGNRQACLRLVEHCAEILISVTEEIHEVGDDTVGRELEKPVEKLTGAFEQINSLLLSLSRRPFLKRYLKRDDIRLEIELCEKSLNDAVVMFGLGIQVRVLRGVLEGLGRMGSGGNGLPVEKADEAGGEMTRDNSPLVRERTLDPLAEDAKEDLSASQMTATPLANARHPFSPGDVVTPLRVLGSEGEGDGKTPKAHTRSLDVVLATTTSTASPVIQIPGTTISLAGNTINLDDFGPSILVPLLSDLVLSSIRSDSKQLAGLLKQTLATGRDEEIVKVMQVGRDEMLEAIVSLRREHERWEDKWREREEEIKKEKEAIVRGQIDEDNGEAKASKQAKPVLGRTLSGVSKISGRSKHIGPETGEGVPLVEVAAPAIQRTSRSSTTGPPPPQPSPSRKMTRLSTSSGAASGTSPDATGGASRGSEPSTPSSNADSVQHIKHASSISSSGSHVTDEEREVERTLRREDEEEEMATLHREFIEGSIDALRRLSRQADGVTRAGSKHGNARRNKGHKNSTRGRQSGSVKWKGGRVEDKSVDGAGVGGLPSWTITRYEVDREKKIGIGFFSDVYKGTWRPPYPITPSWRNPFTPDSKASSQPSSSSSAPSDPYTSPSLNQPLVVAIKVLSLLTPRYLFLREAKIWKSLPPHPNVLELYGASSATADPPWFLVCPYLKEGSLVGYLKRLAGEDIAVGGNSPGKSGALGLSFGPVEPISRPELVNRDSDWPVTSPTSIERQRSTSGGTITTMTTRSPTFPARRGGTQTAGPVVPRESDLHRFMLEIATGMEHLHRHEVLHGDLKAANILVDDQLRCVISDFGQSEMKSEAYQLSGTTRPHGTPRWQAPELLSASQLALTPQMDVYAYAICCIEILGMGRLPWPLADDEAVRNLVLKDDLRPPLPSTRFSTPEVLNLLKQCWDRNPSERPSFKQIVPQVKALGQSRKIADEMNTPPPITSSLPAGTYERQKGVNITPDMRPIPLSSIDPNSTLNMPPLGASPASITTDDTYHTAKSADPESSIPYVPIDAGNLSLRESTVATEARMPIPVIYTPSRRVSSSSSASESSASTRAAEKLVRGRNMVLVAPIVPHGIVHIRERTESPAPKDDRAVMMRDERRYRFLLETRSFHPSLKLPLWTPSLVELGAVGYLLKPSGTFVTLFNAYHPARADDVETRGLPSLRGYGKVQKGEFRRDKRSPAQRGLDAIVGWMTFRTRGSESVSRKVARRYSFDLRSGKKAAYICAETTIYRYMESLDVPKKWFKANVNAVLQIYEPDHHIQREDLLLVIGKLDAPDYGLFVSHNHPDGQVHFNVYSNPRTGQPWGTWTTDRELPAELGGPSYEEPVQEQTQASSKVSDAGGPWNTLMLARLRFKPDVPEPTAL